MKETVVMNRWKKLNKDYFNLGKLSLWNSFTTVMKSFRLDCYPFCARRCLSLKKRRERNWERIEWFTRSKLIVLVCFRSTMVLCALNSIAPLVDVIEFRVSSSSSSAYMFAPKPNPVRLKSKRMEFLWQLHYFTLINSQRFNSKLGNCFLKSTCKLSQTMQVSMEGEGRLHCLKL